MRHYYVYILASLSRALYVGFTGDLPRRLHEHKHGLADGFTKRYKVDRLVYFEVTTDARAGIDRETQIKKWTREKKLRLIEGMNPAWEDLAVTMKLVE
ncbi:MAG TPA: GIY-YIG nuclease family protein [Longimicrobium sp.]|nr:GIY-YIG nuclease family protein [Longimicrobium sp.]